MLYLLSCQGQHSVCEQYPAELLTSTSVELHDNGSHY